MTSTSTWGGDADHASDFLVDRLPHGSDLMLAYVRLPP
jgi:hypothetical protein